MSASLDTVVTNIQNLANAVFTASTNYSNINGLQDFFPVTSTSVIRVGKGRIVKVSVVIAGSSAGTIYDGASISDIGRPIASINNALGIQEIGLPVQYGIVIIPGTGMAVAGSFS